MPTLKRTPSALNLALYAGDGVAIDMAVTYSDGTPYPLTGLVTSQIKAQRTDTDPLTTFTIDPIDLPNGKFSITLTGDQTSALTENTPKFNGVWDLEFTPDGAEPITFLQGNVQCDLDVTRP